MIYVIKFSQQQWLNRQNKYMFFRAATRFAPSQEVRICASHLGASPIFDKEKSVPTRDSISYFSSLELLLLSIISLQKKKNVNNYIQLF